MFLDLTGACEAIARAGEGDQTLRPNLFIAGDALAIGAGGDARECGIHLRDELMGMRVLTGRRQVDGKRWIGANRFVWRKDLRILFRCLQRHRLNDSPGKVVPPCEQQFLELRRHLFCHVSLNSASALQPIIAFAVMRQK